MRRRHETLLGVPRKMDALRILVEPTDMFRNAGDTAMLHVAVTRVAGLWPEASIQLFTDEPDQLVQYAPRVRPLSGAGRYAWHSEPVLRNTRVWKSLPLEDDRSARLERALRLRYPGALVWLRRRRGLLTRDIHEFLTAVTGADLVIVAGMGGITDAFSEYAHDVLDTLSLAQRYGVATVMVGQGLGPISSVDLWRRTRDVFRRLDFISLREGHTGLPLLRRLAMPTDRIMVTGDDAIEVSFRARRDRLGEGLGINLRAASYSEIGSDVVDTVGAVVRTSASRHTAPLVPVPISWVPGEEDMVTITRMVGDYGLVETASVPTSWVDVVSRLGQCRVLVTGSYHAGVFALAQGIPTIGIGRSQYYVDKFAGLASQFGEGCRTLRIGEPGAAATLSDAIEDLWAGADDLRPGLLAKSAQQIDLGHSAYERIRSLVDGRRTRLRSRDIAAIQ